MSAFHRPEILRRLAVPRPVRLRPRPIPVLDRHLRAYDHLLRHAAEAAPALFAHSLAHIRTYLRVDAVLLAREGAFGWEAPWQHPEEGQQRPPASPCRWVQDYPGRTLVIRDARKDGRWSGHPDLEGVGALAAVAVWEGGLPKGALLVLSRRPRSFTRPELALLHAVAGLLGKAQEVETLKQDLQRLQEALALTEAVVEDSSLYDGGSGLPNRRYLEIWLKANLFLAKRRGEPMTVAAWTQPARELKLLRAVAEGLRGEDLMVCEGQGRCLLLLPRTPKGGGQILLHRLRQKLGDLPMVSTLWDPEQDDGQLVSVRQRLAEGMARAMARPGGVVWMEE